MSDRGGSITREGERFPPAPHELEFLALEPPALGAAQEIAGGVLWLRIPMRAMRPCRLAVEDESLFSAKPRVPRHRICRSLGS